MSKLQTLLSIAAVLCFGTAAQAQSCSNGTCSFKQQPNASAGYTAANYGDRYGSSRFQTPSGYDGGTCSFSQACRDCGSVHGPNLHSGDTAQSGLTPRYTAPQDRYAPSRSQYAPTSGYRDYGRPARDIYEPRPTAPYGTACQDCNDPNCDCDVPLPTSGYSANYRPRANDRNRDYDRGFTTGRYDDRNRDRSFGSYRLRTDSNPSLRYQPLTGAGYSFTRAPYNSARLIRWQTDLQQASRQAQQTRRPLMVTVTAEWCSYCTRMKNETLRDARVISQINTAGFIPVKLDADANAQLVSRLGIRSLPATLIVGSDLRILERLDGFRTADQLGQSLRRHSRSAKADSNMKVVQR